MPLAWTSDLNRYQLTDVPDRTTSPQQGSRPLLVEQLIHQRQPLVTDVEVFQEILYRYTAIGR